MLNKPLNSLAELEPRQGLRVAPDEQPGLRLAGVLLVVCLPILVIGTRLVAVQTSGTEPILAEFNRLSESTETIPSRDGRILGTNGQVLAHDVRRFHIAVHYRWLEEPPDERWLKQQALKDLSGRARRDADLVQRRIEQVLQRRRQLWQRLAETSGLDPLELEYLRNRVQDRVERIVDSVEQRRIERRQEHLAQFTQAVQDAQAPWWRRAFEQVRHELTTSPDRSAADPIIVREELDYHRVVADVTFDVAMHVETHPELFPGTSIERATERDYPLGDLAAHVVGVRTPLRADEIEAVSADTQQPAQNVGGTHLVSQHAQNVDGTHLDAHPDAETGDNPGSLEGTGTSRSPAAKVGGTNSAPAEPALRVGDRVGRSGLEQQYNRQLRGRPGLRRVLRNRSGEIVSTSVLREPQVGQDIHLTLNLELQASAEQLLDQTIDSNADTARSSGGASLVVLDVRTGQVVTLANAPRYDLNQMLHATAGQWQAILDDQRQPLFPRSTRMALPPGSVFKTVSSVAVLHSGIIDPDEEFFCQGYLHHPNRYRCYTYRHYGHGHGDLRLVDAITRSCNVYFYHSAEVLGPQPLIDWAGRFGVGRATGIDLPGERHGNLPTPTQRDSQGRQLAWYRGDSLGMAIGQSRLTMTPLQVARMMAAVANGGYLVTPRVVSRTTEDAVIASGQDRVTGSVPKVPIESLDVGLLEQVQEGLRRVVNHPTGTGYKTARLTEVRLAGKTGTAEVGGGRPDHAWFAGYVPADEPRYAFAIVVEHGGSGGRTAGPLARELVERMLELDLLPSASRLASTADGRSN